MIDEHAERWPYQVAQVYAWRNEPDQAFHWLEQARDQHDTWLWNIFRDSFWDNIKEDSRWDAFLETIGLSAAQ